MLRLASLLLHLCLQPRASLPSLIPRCFRTGLLCLVLTDHSVCFMLAMLLQHSCQLVVLTQMVALHVRKEVIKLMPEPTY